MKIYFMLFIYEIRSPKTPNKVKFIPVKIIIYFFNFTTSEWV